MIYLDCINIAQRYKYLKIGVIIISIIFIIILIIVLIRISNLTGDILVVVSEDTIHFDDESTIKTSIYGVE